MLIRRTAIITERYDKDALGETKPGREFLFGKEMLDKSKEILKTITDKFNIYSKRGYEAAVSSINTSKRAGRTTAINMEIALRKRKMKNVFNEIGERIYNNIKTTDTRGIFTDGPIKGLLDKVKAYDKEINELKQDIASLDATGDIEGPDKTRIVPADENNLSGGNFTRWSGFVETFIEQGKTVDISGHVEAMKDADPKARINALKGLFKSSGSETIPHLVSALKDKDKDVRRHSALYLGWKGALSAAEDLVITACDKDSSVRKASLEALGEMKAKEAVPALIRGLDDADSDVRRTAYKSLTRTTNKFIEFDADDSLSTRFMSIKRWEKWWKAQVE